MSKYIYLCSLIWHIHLGTANNAGAILVVGRGLVVVPKLIHPLPPPLQSPETSPERIQEDTWMQVCLLDL
jgi:protein phosphatase